MSPFPRTGTGVSRHGLVSVLSYHHPRCSVLPPRGFVRQTYTTVDLQGRDVGTVKGPRRWKTSRVKQEERVSTNEWIPETGQVSDKWSFGTRLLRESLAPFFPSSFLPFSSLRDGGGGTRSVSRVRSSADLWVRLDRKGVSTLVPYTPRGPSRTREEEGRRTAKDAD